jgi:hypothetical protein
MGCEIEGRVRYRMELPRKEIRSVGKLGPARGVIVGCVVAAVFWILFGLAVWLAVHLIGH